MFLAYALVTWYLIYNQNECKLVSMRCGLSIEHHIESQGPLFLCDNGMKLSKHSIHS